MHIAADVWLGKGNPAPTLLASYFTLGSIHFLEGGVGGRNSGEGH